MEDETIPGIPAEDPEPAPDTPSPVIPAPRRAAQPMVPAGDANTTLDTDPFERTDVPEPAAQVAAPAEPEAVVPEPTAPAEPAAQVAAPVEPEAPAVEGAEPAPAGEALGETAAVAPGEPETTDVPRDASIEDMVAELRTGEPEPEAGASDGQPAEVAGAEPAAEAPSADEIEPEGLGAGVMLPDEGTALRRRSARVPFYVYLGVWAVFAGVLGYLMWPLATAPFVDQSPYGVLVMVGLGLVCAGPVLGLFVWWWVRAHSDPSQRGGLVRAVLLRTAASMAGGVLLWWAALLLLDMRRTGVLG